MTTTILATMTVAEFRAFKKALAVLLRAGVDRDTAIDILCRAWELKHVDSWQSPRAVTR